MERLSPEISIQRFSKDISFPYALSTDTLSFVKENPLASGNHKCEKKPLPEGKGSLSWKLGVVYGIVTLRVTPHFSLTMMEFVADTLVLTVE